MEKVVAFANGTPNYELIKAGYLTKPDRYASLITRNPPSFLFHYVVEGEGWAKGEDGVQVHCRAGDWFICNPKSMISYQSSKNNPWRYMWICFMGHQDIQHLPFINPEVLVLDGGGQVDEEIEPLVLMMVTKLANKDESSSLLANAYLLQLLAKLSQDRREVKKNSSSTSTDEVIKKALLFITTHFQDDIRVNDVVEHCGYERSYLSKIFSEQTGMSIKGCISKHKIRHAKHLLMNRELSSSEIGQSVGYADQTSFVRFFKQMTGVPPCTWQKNKLHCP